MPARVTVVGGGVTALLTAVECVLDGHRVTVVDQGSGAHGRAGSAGRPRILRALHPADPAATGAALRAHHRWAALEELLLTRFYEQVGALTVLPPAAAADGAALVEYAGGTARELTAAGLSHRYPHLHLAGDLGAVLEEEAGVLLAERVLAACAGWLKWQRGTELVERRAVTAVDCESGTVRLVDGQVLRGDAVLVAAGPRSRNLLPGGIAEQLTGLFLWGWMSHAGGGCGVRGETHDRSGVGPLALQRARPPRGLGRRGAAAAGGAIQERVLCMLLLESGRWCPSPGWWRRPGRRTHR